MAESDVLLYLSDVLEDVPWQVLVGASALITSVFLLLPYLRTTIYEQPVLYTVPAPEQADPAWKGEFIDEPTLKVSGSTLINAYDPSTGYSLGHIPATTASSLDKSITLAHAAQASWSLTTFSQRRRVLRTLLRFLIDNQTTINRVCARDCGKPILDASLGDTLMSVEKLSWLIKHGEAALTPSSRPTNLLLAYKRNTVRYEPLGLVAACVSWNYPFHNFFGPVIAAIFAGNGIIVKPSERTAWSSQYFLAIVRGALSACGHDPELVQSVPMWPNTADHLTSHPGIAHITFIGSQEVAKSVCSSAAKQLIPVCAELGGKDPAIVLDNIDSVERVGEIILRGTFQGAGQNCIGIERVICLPKIHDKLVAYLHSRIKTIRLGSELSDSAAGHEIDMGALAGGERIAHLESLIADAVKNGATLLTGGTRFNHPRWPKGHYFLPTLLTDIIPSMSLAQTELFAPVLAIMRATSIPHAISLANSTSYALGASVFGTNSADINAVVAGVKAGMVAVNDFGSFYMVQLPFGGVKGSGYGRFAGAEGLQALCNLKAVCEDRVGWMGVRTSIPPVYQYPVEVGRARRVAESLVKLGYGLGWGEMLVGLVGVVGNMGRTKKK